MIGGRRIADDEPCYVIAEIGSNHQGQEGLAHQLIDMAARCGAHAVKFQRRTNERLYSRALLDQPYDNEVSFGATYGAHRAALELRFRVLRALRDHAHEEGLAFVCTAFDEQAVSDLNVLEVDAIKIASGGVTDHALIAAAVGTKLPLIISTGGCTEADIRSAHTWAPDAALLHCTASYPCAFDELNLRCIARMRQLFPGTTIGWSGHDNGIAMAMAAYVLGARIIEKHITLNRAMKGTDHAFSLEHSGLEKLCRDLARAHVALGDGVKRYYESEKKPIAKMRRRQTPEGLRITGGVDS
jgi:N-acetylneuraminate synthase/sialic acid synthase